MTTNDTQRMCPCCGHAAGAEGCRLCAGESRTLGRHTVLKAGRGNAFLDVLRGLDDVPRAVFALIFERQWIGILRVPVAANLFAISAMIAIGWLWLAPAYGSWFRTAQASSEHDGPHLWLIATWLVVGMPLLDLLAGFAQQRILRATEAHMLGTMAAATPVHRRGLRERLLFALAGVITLPLALGLVLIPYIGIPAVVLLGAAVAALVWLQAPMAARGLSLQRRLELLRANPWRAFGTGLGMQLATAVPFVNLLGLAPIATIAATSSYLHFDKEPQAAPGPVSTA